MWYRKIKTVFCLYFERHKLKATKIISSEEKIDPLQGKFTVSKSDLGKREKLDKWSVAGKESQRARQSRYVYRSCGRNTHRRWAMLQLVYTPGSQRYTCFLTMENYAPPDHFSGYWLLYFRALIPGSRVWSWIWQWVAACTLFLLLCKLYLLLKILCNFNKWI